MIVENLLEEMMASETHFEIGLSILLLYYLLLVIAQWKLFKKAGEKGWKALIPFYNLFVSHHLIGMSHIWFILDTIFWVVEVVLELTHAAPEWLEEAFMTIAILFTVIAEIIHIMKLCYCYTKSELFGIGLFICPPLFSLILAFDKNAEYHPPRNHHKKQTAKS